MLRRKRLRVTSIFLASEISSSRVSSGIVRHLRQVHADRVARAAGQAGVQDERAIAVIHGVGVFGQVAAVGIGAVDELDAESVERGEQGIDAFGAFGFVRQIWLTCS